ncbi:hypothetical protein [Pseudotamlana carrageenivorans]|uniref:Uncharacterized protein n=1 Tax=Pseudotamlana carrageenivorans TaxID=2069432 RepID=A0A2I7SF43_9FLAO|nr:hypothetical protein [Tamlana carrageenivorans]AUS04480.1 hypothetical protein C1A40_02885 [Tamlana carrageenivorans]
MALNKTQLQADIKNLLTEMMQRENTSIDEFAERLSNSIDDYVKSASIQYNSGLVAPNGAVTGTFNGNLN